MSRERVRAFQHLEFGDPRPFLVQLRGIEARVANSDLPSKLKALRANSLKWSKELREAALFCYGMAQRIGKPVYLSPLEAQDYDFIASWHIDATQHFSPVQLKEVVPQALNAEASVQATVDALSKKYVDSEDLTIAIHLNQRIHFDPAKLVIPSLKIAALWIFGAISQDQEKWGLWGNFLETPEGTQFEYPT